MAAHDEYFKYADSKEPLLVTPDTGTTPPPARPPAPACRLLPRAITNVPVTLALLLAALSFTFLTAWHSQSPAQSLHQCAWSRLEQHVSLLDVPPILRHEFLQRQQNLGHVLRAEGVDAFIAEQSASTAYYANISASAHLSERPFLVIIDSNGQFSYLVPEFEAARIASLDMVYATKSVIPWAETDNPYAVLKKTTKFNKVMLDEHARFMIASGLEAAGLDVVPMSKAVHKLRTVKLPSEIAILRAINTFTLMLVRSLRPCIRLGMTQELVVETAGQLFARAGVGARFAAIALFGDRASSPHGGVPGKTLQHGEFVVIDIGSSLHGYMSDLTRTMLPPGSTVSSELWDAWHLVQRSQTAALEHMRPNMTCADVDAASRKVMSDAGFGPYYAHRLGHGLGIEMHEHPYLNGANHDKLSLGEVATNEPGIYVTTSQAPQIGYKTGFGIRHEDAVVVTESGGEILTGRRAVSPYDP